MRQFQATTILTASPDAIWPHMSEVVRWPEWMDTFTRVVALDGDELALRRRFRVEQPRLRPAIWTVTRLEPNASFSWESRFRGLRLVADHRLASHTSGTLLQLQFGFGGLLSPIVATLFGRLVGSYLARECAAYQRRLGAIQHTANG
jgi:hypothetical protein